MSQKITVSRNLIIGLGGTGMRAVMQTKARCKQMWGTIPNCVQFLFFDTDKMSRDFPSPLVKSDLDNDYFRMEVPDPPSIVKNHPEIKNSIPVRNIKHMGNFNSGAGQIRSRGRLALVANYQQIKDAVENKFTNITNYALDDRFDLVEAKDVNVYVITSFAGGTGSGMFVDMNYIIRAVASSINTQLNMQLIFLLPEIYRGLPTVNFINVNTYAALLECEYLAQPSNAKLEIVRESEFILPYMSGLNNIVNKESKFYDIVIPVDGVSNIVSYTDANELADFLGKSLFTTLGAVGGAGISIWNNALIAIANANQMGGAVNGKYFRTMGMGYSELYYDRRGMLKCAVNELISSATQELLLGGNVKNKIKEKEVFIWEDFINKELNERMHNNEVIDKILDLKKIKDLTAEAFSSVNTKKENTVSDMRKWIQDSYIRDKKANEEEAKKNSEAKLNEIKDKINNEYITKIDKYGINGLIEFKDC